jgi:class 3 adenylate cyclase/CHASE3 domain sensor protein
VDYKSTDFFGKLRFGERKSCMFEALSLTDILPATRVFMRIRTTIFVKQLLGFGVILLLTALLALAAYLSMNRIGMLASDILRGPVAAKHHALLAESYLQQARTLEQRFLIHLDTDDVEMFKNATDSAKSHVWLILTTDSIGNPDHHHTIVMKRKAAELERSIAQYYQGFSDIVWEISLRAEKRMVSFTDVLRSDTAIQHKYTAYTAKAERSSVLAKEISAIAETEMLEVTETMNTTRRQAITTFLSLSALILLTGLGISFVFSRRISVSIKQIRDAAQQVAGGMRSMRLDIRSGDELEDLAVSFNAMVTNLDQMFSDIEEMFVELEDKSLELASTNEQNKRLLLNVLPEGIADRLIAGESLIADEHQEATILFADIVGFTRLSAQQSAVEIVQMLNWLFSIFDELCEKNGVEKIKTIGDSYMAVCGIPAAREDHLEAIANLALAMIPEIEGFARLSGLPIAVRIGIHTGSVVAGVIGKRKFIYDLWGDTVNTASRMESSGEANKIHVSEKVFSALKSHYTFEERGMIEVKSKGQMRTYFLTGNISQEQRS